VFAYLDANKNDLDIKVPGIPFISLYPQGRMKFMPVQYLDQDFSEGAILRFLRKNLGNNLDGDLWEDWS